MNSPLLTILLPVHNGASLLPATLESVFSQTFAAWELLVIDDGSTDATPEILRAITDPRLRVLTNGVNCGLTASLNRGLAEARGELIARQDADDLSTRERFEKQIARFREQPALVLLGSSAWRLDPEGRVTGTNDMPATHPAIRWASVTDNPFLHTSVMFRRDPILREHGGYDESFSICQDYELWNRIATRHRVANLRQHLVGMREHPRSMTQTRALETSAEVRRLLEPNWATIFPNRPLTRDEGDLLAVFRLQLSPAQLVKLRKLLDVLRSEFVAAHPAAARDRDFRATLCRQSLRLAYKSLRQSPPLACQEILRAFIESPREWLRQACAARFHLYRGEWPR